MCHCCSAYVQRTFQRLEDRIKKHIPKLIYNQIKPQKILPTEPCQSTQKNIPESDYTLGLYLQNKIYA